MARTTLQVEDIPSIEIHAPTFATYLSRYWGGGEKRRA